MSTNPSPSSPPQPSPRIRDTLILILFMAICVIFLLCFIFGVLTAFLTAILLLIEVIVVFVTALSGFFRNVWQNAAKKGVIIAVAIIIVVAFGLLRVGFTYFSPPSVTPKPSPIKTITENLAIPCVDCKNPGISVHLDNIMIDTVKKNMFWNFTITNNGSSACTRVYFTLIELEDQVGMIYPGEGQAKDNWLMGPGTSQDKHPFFNFQPQPWERYTLNLEIGTTPDCGSVNTYQFVSFTFPAGVLGVTPTLTSPGIRTVPDMERNIPCGGCKNPRINVRLENIMINTVKKNRQGKGAD